MGTEQTPSIPQQHAINLLEQIIESRRPVKELELYIYNSFADPRIRHLTMREAGFFDVTVLAIDALGNSDAGFLLDLYKSGGKIEEEILGDLATAVIIGRRRHTDCLDEYNEIRERRGAC